MPDMPSDPRQLARDILAGKISIEELARQQARRRGMPAPAPPKPMTRPAQRQVPTAAPPIQTIPSARHVPTFPARRSGTQPGRPVPATIRQPIPPQPPRAPVPSQTYGLSASSATRKPAPQTPAAVPLTMLLRDPRNLAKAFVLSEIFAPTLALRDEIK
jgi:hypothetical protein